MIEKRDIEILPPMALPSAMKLQWSIEKANILLGEYAEEIEKNDISQKGFNKFVSEVYSADFWLIKSGKLKTNAEKEKQREKETERLKQMYAEKVVETMMRIHKGYQKRLVEALEPLLDAQVAFCDTALKLNLAGEAGDAATSIVATAGQTINLLRKHILSDKPIEKERDNGN